MSHPDHLEPDDTISLKDILARCPELQEAAGHVRGFAAMMTNRDGHLLDDWIAATAAGDSPHLACFATGLRRDHAVGARRHHPEVCTISFVQTALA